MNVRNDLVTEAELQRSVLELARLAGWTHRYHTHDSRRSEAGFPDLVLVRGDELVMVELKRNRGTLSPAQVSWMDALARAGVECYVWRPRDWPLIEERLARRRR